jgi:hypothetical protein
MIYIDQEKNIWSEKSLEVVRSSGCQNVLRSSDRLGIEQWFAVTCYNVTVVRSSGCQNVLRCRY